MYRKLTFTVIAIILVPVITAAVTYLWPTTSAAPPPGGYATITIENPKHGQRYQGSNLTLRIRSDNPLAAVRLYIDGKPFTAMGVPLDPNDNIQFEFTEGLVLTIPIQGLAPGSHRLEVRSGSTGSSLPVVNEQRIEFLVKQ
jgi:hypothetical protein